MSRRRKNKSTGKAAHLEHDAFFMTPSTSSSSSSSSKRKRSHKQTTHDTDGDSIMRGAGDLDDGNSLESLLGGLDGAGRGGGGVLVGDGDGVGAVDSAVAELVRKRRRVLDDAERRRRREGGAGGDEEGDEDDGLLGARETPDEMRLRRAKQLLAAVRRDSRRGVDRVGSGDEAEDESEDEGDESDSLVVGDPSLDPTARALHQQVLKKRGVLQRGLSQRVDELDASCVQRIRGHKLTLTSVALAGDDRLAVTGGKDGSVICYDLAAAKRVSVLYSSRGTSSGARTGHTKAVLSVAVSSDGKFVASAGADRVIHISDPRSGQIISSFTDHRDTVSALTFRKDTHILFSGSYDRTVRIWDLDQMGFVDTLFGHANPVTDIDALLSNTALSSGGDKTLRLWKVVEQSQLVFQNYHKASVDCARMLSQKRFISGSQDGTVALWSTRKKKPQWAVRRAHGGEWISSVAALPFSDLAASGSCDGKLRLWHCPFEGESRPRLSPLREVDIPGYINGMAFAKTGRFLIAAVGQEHRLGRWGRVRAGRNQLHVVALRRS